MRGLFGALWIAVLVGVIAAMTAVPDRRSPMGDQQPVQGQAAYDQRERNRAFN